MLDLERLSRQTLKVYSEAEKLAAPICETRSGPSGSAT